MTSTTVARLRPLLGDFFDRVEVDSALRVMRQAWVVPSGGPGYGGCRSARLDAPQTVLVLLALASNDHPKNAPAEAARIGAFRLLRRDIGEPPRSVEYQNQQINLLDALVCQLARGDDPEDPLPGWSIGRHDAMQVAPDRLVFGDGEPADEVERRTLLGCRLLADIAELFRQDRAEAA